jgi:hypothetical protein
VGVFNGREMATGVLQWSTAAPAASPAILLQGRFNLTLSGSFTGLAATLQRSFDNAAASGGAPRISDRTSWRWPDGAVVS